MEVIRLKYRFSSRLKWRLVSYNTIYGYIGDDLKIFIMDSIKIIYELLNVFIIEKRDV